ncbi:hypothetical protein D478_27122 [Brevibacillus agri BAB-2500]|nr:hypothetical protein D478_27122 [Brevibacillus agri BAB-2500]
MDATNSDRDTDFVYLPNFFAGCSLNGVSTNWSGEIKVTAINCNVTTDNLKLEYRVKELPISLKSIEVNLSEELGLNKTIKYHNPYQYSDTVYLMTLDGGEMDAWVLPVWKLRSKLSNAYVTIIWDDTKGIEHTETIKLK